MPRSPRHRPVLRVVSLLTAGLLSGSPAAGGLPPDQPFASFWFPDELLTWSPETDRDAPFNRSGVALRNRFLDAATQVNPHARPGEGLIGALSVMYPTTSNNPSQGSLDFETYAFGYWQYLDLLVFWGGSAGEGLILAPNPGVIEAAHRNGVPVYGNIFFPPNVFGGDLQWVRDLVQRAGESFPVADKLIEVATYYGFDGWFINQETAGGDAALASEIRDFMRYVQSRSTIGIQWYDAMTESGAIDYQNALTAENDAFLEELGRVSDSMFLNYFWSPAGLTSSANLATALGRSPYDLFAGANIAVNGFNTPINWNGVFPEGQAHRVSLGFFGNQWAFDSSTSVADFYARANRVWVGPNGDPSNTETPLPWKGIAHYVPARSPLDDLPFVTHFNTGQGQRFAVDGEVLSVGDWNNRGLQDVLPTWRWIRRGVDPILVPELDFSDAYDGGSCLRISGDLLTPMRLDLYKTRLPVGPQTRAQIAFKTGSAGTPSNLELGLAFFDGGGLTPFTFLAAGAAATADWNLVSFDLAAAAGQTIAVVALRFAAAGAVPGYEIKVGRLAVIDGAVEVPQAPSSLVIDAKEERDPGTATLRLLWDHSPDPVHAYNVYRRDPGGGRTYLGGSPNNAYFVAAVQRAGAEASTTVEVEAVGPAYGRSAPAAATFLWDEAIVFLDGFESGDAAAWSLAAP